MNTIIRLLIIILAISIVVGATWAVGQSSSSNSQTGFVQGERPNFEGSGDRPAPPEGFDRNAAQFTSLFGWMGLGETVAEIAIIITLIALPTTLWNRRRRTRQQTAATAA